MNEGGTKVSFFRRNQHIINIVMAKRKGLWIDLDNAFILTMIRHPVNHEKSIVLKKIFLWPMPLFVLSKHKQCT
jgi:hypothetical protein